MLRITVEVFPQGNVEESRVIATMHICNSTPFKRVKENGKYKADYEGKFTMHNYGTNITTYSYVKRHERSRPLANLIAKLFRGLGY